MQRHMARHVQPHLMARTRTRPHPATSHERKKEMENQAFEGDQSRDKDVGRSFLREARRSSASTDSADSRPDSHVYEDIRSLSWEETIMDTSCQKADTTQCNGDEQRDQYEVDADVAPRSTVCGSSRRSSEDEDCSTNAFQRNLTLPLRRGSATNQHRPVESSSRLTKTPTTRSSVRVTSKELMNRVGELDDRQDRLFFAEFPGGSWHRRLDEGVHGDTDRILFLQHQQQQQYWRNEANPSNRRRRKKDCKRCGRHKATYSNCRENVDDERGEGEMEKREDRDGDEVEDEEDEGDDEEEGEEAEVEEKEQEQESKYEVTTVNRRRDKAIVNQGRERVEVSGLSPVNGATILSPGNVRLLPFCCNTARKKATLLGSSPVRNVVPSTIFSISESARRASTTTTTSNGSNALKYIEYRRNVDVETTKLAHVVESKEDKALFIPEKTRPGMRVNSIYSQDHWYAKEAPIFFTDVKEQSPFQRAYSLPIRTQTPSSQNRVNLRRSVRGEPPPYPARLHKHRRGWTLHLARPLEGSGCTRSLVLLLIVVLALLGVGAIALYIVFEPQKLQIIQQYLRSNTGNSSAQNATSGMVFVPSVANASQDVTPFKRATSTTTTMRTRTTTTASRMTSDTPTLGALLNAGMQFPASTSPASIAEAETSRLEIDVNSTRHCDDCLDGEVCVGLIDEEVPICRIGLDPEDPTGCAGLCLINKQRCHRLDVDAFRCVEVEHYCLDDEWMCANTLCIPMEKRCDGHMNCYDHSDEYSCVCNLETHFQCGNETSCLPLERRCDGKLDCWDAVDEISCTLGHLGWSCPRESEFTCSNGQCILRARFCDGLQDCVDGSDEPHGCEGRCNKYEFTCQNSRCITKGAKCNGVDDCGDGTDEQHCKDRVT